MTQQLVAEYLHKDFDFSTLSILKSNESINFDEYSDNEEVEDSFNEKNDKVEEEEEDSLNLEQFIEVMTRKLVIQLYMTYESYEK